MTRNRLVKALKAGGVNLGPKGDALSANVVDFVSVWGVLPGVPGSGTDTPDIKAALDAAGIPWSLSNIVIVQKSS